MNLIGFYTICFIIAMILLIYFVCVEDKTNIFLTHFILVIAISNGGYLALALSSELKEAILANKVIYISGCFIPMLLFLVVCEICGVKRNPFVIAVMYMIQTAIYWCVCTIGFSDIYYKTVELHTGAASYLTKTYGFTHIFYSVTLYGYMTASLLALILALRRKAAVSYKMASFVLVSYTATVAVLTLERAFHWQVELMPFMYTLSFVTMGVVIRRSASYSVIDNVQKMIEQNSKNGYICFDKKQNYMGCNACAEEIMPELKKMNIDRPIAYGENLLYHRVKPALDDFARTGMQTTSALKVGSKTYEIKVNPLKRANNTVKGYMVELSDATDHQNYLEMIEDYNRNLESEVDGKTHKIREMQDRVLMGMAQMVESRDLSTGGHIKRTSAVVKVFARQLLKEDMGFTREFLYYVEKSAPMHDLGKIAVDDAILRKQGRFTDEDYAVMKTHSAAGAGIVRDILTGVEAEEFVEIAANVAHYHHEKVDGSGYPDGLRGEEIPVEARIMALADVFDALVSKRCYKEPFSYDKAFSIIEESNGSHFDEKLGSVFMKCRRELESLYDGFAEEEQQES